MIDVMVFELAAAIISVLLGGNIFFVKKLVERIDDANTAITRYDEKITALNEKIQGMSVLMKDISDLKADIAVLKFAVNHGITIGGGIGRLDAKVRE